MVLKITDVASHQGNYALGSNGEDGVIIKATQGTGYINPNCDYVAQQAIKQNKPWGLYHYAGGEDAVAEADYFVKNIEGYLKVANKPVLNLDWESYQNAAYGNGAWAETFLKRLKEKTGVQGGIYGNSGDLAQMTQWVVDNAWVWFAGYPYAAGTTSMIKDWSYPNFPYSTGKFKTITGWQFSSDPLDKSVFYLDEKTWAKLAGSSSTPSVDPTPTPTPNPSQPKLVKSETIYALHQKGGNWLGNIANFNNSNSAGFAGMPSGSHDLLYLRTTHGSIKYRVHTIEDGWLPWVYKGDPTDTVNGCAGIPGHTIDGVQCYYTTPSGEVYQQARYHSQTAKRAGWLPPVVDDADFAGIFGEPLDRLQVAISNTNPF